LGYERVVRPPEGVRVGKRYEFRVCQVQHGRVTFVDGEWAGELAPTPDRAEQALRTCPTEWDYLRAAGAEGWDLAGVAGGVGGETNAHLLYLRRELD
jgi:hypothetical protein